MPQLDHNETAVIKIGGHTNYVGDFGLNNFFRGKMTPNSGPVHDNGLTGLNMIFILCVPTCTLIIICIAQINK